MGKPLTAENLVADFGAKAEFTRRGVATQTYYATVVRALVERCCGPQAAELLGDGPLASDAGTRLRSQLSTAVAEYDVATPDEGGDLLRPLYQDLFPRRMRHELGEYYTPDWLAREVLDRIGCSGDPAVRLLDPSCGSGVFLVTAIRRILAGRHGEAPSPDQKRELCRKILAGVVGFDVNPLAVMTARANYLIAIAELLPYAKNVVIPIYRRDTILDQPGGEEQFDGVVGNPPWIAWDNLPDDYRAATKALWERYGLFSLSGSKARHGGGKKDLAMLLLYVAADRYLKSGGRLAMVVTQTLFQTKGAGDGFRRFRLGHGGDWLRVLRVDDMTALRPFEDAANWTSTILLQKGEPTQYPVPYVKWSPGDDGAFDRTTYTAEPIDPDRPGSPWFLRPPGWRTPLNRLTGASDYTARLGANSGGANGVYWVEVLDRCNDGVLVRNIAGKSRRKIEPVRCVIEPELLYPLVRWADVALYRADASSHIILAQDVVTRTGVDIAIMRREYPRTYAYLEQFEPLLASRAAYKRYQGKGPFYSMYNVGTYTVAPIKVVWRRMDRRIRAAVLPLADDPVLGRRPVVPQETCVLIPCDSMQEAHYVCAVLNSAVVGFLVASHSVSGGKGFGTPSMLDYIRLRRFNPSDSLHAELAAYGREAHRAVAEGADLRGIQDRIDRATTTLWGLTNSELAAIPP